MLLGYDQPPFPATGHYEEAKTLWEFESRLMSGARYDGILVSPALRSTLPHIRRLAPESVIIAHLEGPAAGEISLDAFQRGADDFLVTDSELREGHLLGRFQVALARRELTMARQQPAGDALTGLQDRRQFLAALEEWLRRPLAGRSVAVMILDIDTFKAINDSLGHAVGDELLQAVGGRLAQLTEDGVLCARIGPDHFAVATRQTRDLVAARVFAEALIAMVRRPYNLGSAGQDIYITVSLGLTLSETGASAQPHADQLLRQADIALAQAKQQGRAMVNFEPGQADDVCYKHVLRNKLHSALSKHEFFLLYQPLVSGRTGQVEGVEALLRWQHPTLGLVGPDAFIPLLEETGLIAEVGFWVIEAACRQLQAWLESGEVDASFSVAINISSKQFHHSDLEGFIRSIVQSTGINAGQIKLELTESLLVLDSELVTTKLQRLKALGVSICIDDFGTGYASLSYLRQFPIDILKIDRTFVKNIGAGPRDDAIILAIINLAHELDFEVIAEGVETAEQRTYLSRHRCDWLQGYLFSKPQPAWKISEQLTRSHYQGKHRLPAEQPCAAAAKV